MRCEGSAILVICAVPPVLRPGVRPVTTSIPPRFIGASTAIAITMMKNPPSQPTSARHKCRLGGSASGANSVAPVVVKSEIISNHASQ